MNKRFVGQSLAYATASIAPILANFAITPFVTRILGPASYGAVAISISLFQFGIVILTLGLAASITRQAIIGRTAANGAVATVVSGAICAAIIFGSAWIFLPLWGPLVLPGTDYGILVNPLMSCLGLAFLQNSQSFFRAEQRIGVFVLLGTAASLVAPLAGISLVLIVNKSPATYLAGLAAVHLAIGFVAILLCLRIKRPKFDLREFLTSLRIGLPTVPHQMSTSMVALTLVSIMSHASGLEAAGALQLGLLVGSAPMLLLGAFNNAWAPLVYRAPDESRESLLADTYKGFMQMTAIMICGFAVMAPFVVPLVAGPLSHAFPITQVALIAALGAPFMTSYLANIHLVFLSGRTAALAVTTPSSALIALIIVMTPGLLGMPNDIRTYAWAVPIFQASQLIMSIGLRRRCSRLKLPSFVLLPEFIFIVGTLSSSYLLLGHIKLSLGIAVTLLLALMWVRRNTILRYLNDRRSLHAGV